jgi:hypothetical protein
VKAELSELVPGDGVWYLGGRGRVPVKVVVAKVARKYIWVEMSRRDVNFDKVTGYEPSSYGNGARIATDAMLSRDALERDLDTRIKSVTGSRCGMAYHWTVEEKQRLVDLLDEMGKLWPGSRSSQTVPRSHTTPTTRPSTKPGSIREPVWCTKVCAGCACRSGHYHDGPDHPPHSHG